MTTTSDWPHGVDPMPSIEPSSDLFDGDILGDELIDIYNAAVVGGCDESMDGKLVRLDHVFIFPHEYSPDILDQKSRASLA